MTTTTDQSVPLSSVIFEFTPDYVRDLISRVLQLRSKVSEGMRSALDSAIADSVRMDGFRDASKAPPHLLRQYMLDEMADGNDRLTGAVFRAWAESHTELYDLVAQHLRRQGVPSDGPNLRERVFDSTWPRDEWMDEAAAIVESNPGLDADDVGMMVCYVSGMAPEPDEERPGVTSPVLSEWIDRLRELPYDASEWEEIEAFLNTVDEIAAEKAIDRAIHRIAELAQSLDETLQAVRRDFESELGYLGLDLASWNQDAAERPAAIADALELAEELRDNLAEYKSVRPQADSREKEAARAVERAERESAIFDIAAKWGRTVQSEDDPDDDPSGGETLGADSDDPDDRRTQADAGSESEPPPAPDRSIGREDPSPSVPVEEYQALLSERDRLRQESETLRSENDRLAQERLDLESDKRSLDSENSELRGELSQIRVMEESWRRAYVSARVADAGRDSATPEQPGSVNEAVARAEELFSDQLVFALNSKSAKNSPFQKPDEVFDALAWLATVYHPRRTKTGKPPHFDKLLKESCSGWSYKTQQTDVTKEQFEQWYTTTVDGRRYDLGPHLGKGTSFDPQNTIRVAFAWDEELRKVVIGYIGLHQRNRRS